MIYPPVPTRGVLMCLNSSDSDFVSTEIVLKERRFHRSHNDDSSRVNGGWMWRAVLTLSLWMVVGYGCGDDAGMIDPASSVDSSPPPVAVPPAEPMTSPEPTTPSVATRNVVIINEVFPEASQIELHNQSSSPADISRFWICHTSPALVYDRLPDDTIIAAGDFLIVHWGVSGTNTEKEIFLPPPAVPLHLNLPHGEVGFYSDFGFDEANFATSEFLFDYVQWGEGRHWRERVAADGNIWPAGTFVPTPNAGQSLSFDGDGDTPEDWVVTDSTIGSANILP